MHSKLGALAGRLVIRLLLLAWVNLEVTALWAQAAAPRRSGQVEPELPILSVRVGSFIATNVDVEEALKLLRAKDVSNVVIGFERTPHDEGRGENRISLDVANASVGDLMRKLCQAEPHYEYEVVQNRLIEVRPKGAKQDANDLLNIKVTNYSIDRNELPGGAIQQIAQDAPELREFLDRKAQEWIKKTGRYPGYPGSIISGNMTPPRFTLKLHDVTVREVLNAIALKSIDMFKEGKLYGPAGWEYDFVIDPDAATGLGGYPKWRPF